jgi:hypothetical protein
MIQSLLLSTACLVSAPEPASAPRPEMQPHATILAGVKAARRNELARFLSLTLSQAQFKELEREWEKQRREPVNDAEDAQFQQTMAMLTAPGAEDQIMAMIKPKLDEMRPNMAMMVGMITGMAQSSIEQNAGLGAEEKAQARKIVAGMTKVLQEHDLASEASARKAVGIVCSTARRLNLKSLGDVQRLSFNQLLARGGIAFGGLKQTLGVYGLEVDEWLDSIQAETVRVDGTAAVVRVTHEVFGVTQSLDTDMVQVGGRWICKETTEQFKID